MKIDKILLSGEGLNRFVTIFYNDGSIAVGRIRFPDKDENVDSNFFSRQLKNFKVKDGETR